MRHIKNYFAAKLRCEKHHCLALQKEIEFVETFGGWGSRGTNYLAITNMAPLYPKKANKCPEKIVLKRTHPA